MASPLTTDEELARILQEDEYHQKTSCPRPPSHTRTPSTPSSGGSSHTPRATGSADVSSDYMLAREMQKDIDAESAQGRRGYHHNESHLHSDLRNPHLNFDLRNPHPHSDPRNHYLDSDLTNHKDNNASSKHRVHPYSGYHGNMEGTSHREPHPHDIDMSYESLSELQDVGLGVDRNTLSRITSTHFHKGNGSETKSCSVCLCHISRGELLRTLPCLHIFHRDCVDQWLEEHNQCPVCMEEVTKHTHRVS